MYLKVNGIEMSSTTYVKESEQVNITCHAIGARPTPQITWMGYYSNYTQMQQIKTLNSTFDITSTLILNASKDEDVFICRSRIDEANITDEISVKLVSYVLPEPILTVEDNSSDVIYIEQEERVTITCDASGAKPQPKLSWMINGYPVDETIFKISRPSDVFSTLILQPRQNDTVKCTIFLPGPNETKMDSITFYVKVRNEGQSEDGRFDNLIIWIVISLAATFMTVVVCCVGFARRRVTGESAFTFLSQLNNIQERRFVLNIGGMTCLSNIYCVKKNSQWAISQIFGGHVPSAPRNRLHDNISSLQSIVQYLQYINIY
ncbi:hypothetical protein HOLleu_36217 [Holothuria leucospilota]|uniref:Ig-like domain-containing protein n=1 Tax=Holothuria leucospilota TaxID=206669 RepID=A0A9Q1BEI4_HOLLE|nr:hypothetical protein HOLleu_36217 [Holothuria leucospilota]